MPHRITLNILMKEGYIQCVAMSPNFNHKLTIYKAINGHRTRQLIST